jgi:hypothetical protein
MSYDMIDRFLRNNLGDDDYAEYSAALDSLCSPQLAPQPSLTDEQVIEMAVKSNLGNALKPVGMDTGHVFMTDKAYRTDELLQLARAIEAAHGIKE